MPLLTRSPRRAVSGSAVLALLLLPAASPAAGAAGADTGWSAYLHGPRHSSDAATASAISPARVAGLHVAWRWSPVRKPGVAHPVQNASPVTAAGTVYVNSGTGDVYALDETTGRQRWRRVLPASPCGSTGSTSTPTVAVDPVSSRPTLYVAGADNRLYALDPATGATRWRTVHGGTDAGYYTWGSPTVANGRVYLAVSSSPCSEFSHGGAAVYDQHTGALLGSYTTATTGQIPTVYTSLAVTATTAYLTTGDGSTGDSDALVALDARTLARRAAFAVPDPPDNSDFNASPAFFTRNGATVVGACNKDGVYYALPTTGGGLGAAPVWTRRVALDSQAQPGRLRFCGGASAYDGSADALLVGGGQSSLADPDLGSVYRLDPVTGAVRWRTALRAGPVVGSVSVNAAGVVAAPTYDGVGGVGTVALLDEATGSVLRTLPAAGPVFAQPTFSRNHLLVGAGAGLTAWVP